MFAGPWLKGFGWGTDEMVSPEEIYPAVSAEEAAKMPASSKMRDKAKRVQAEREPQHEAEMEAPSAAATAELAEVAQRGEGASQDEAGPAATAAQVFKPICLAVIAWVLAGSYHHWICCYCLNAHRTYLHHWICVTGSWL